MFLFNAWWKIKYILIIWFDSLIIYQYIMSRINLIPFNYTTSIEFKCSEQHPTYSWDNIFPYDLLISSNGATVSTELEHVTYLYAMVYLARGYTVWWGGRTRWPACCMLFRHGGAFQPGERNAPVCNEQTDPSAISLPVTAQPLNN